MTVSTAPAYRTRSAEVIARYGKLATANYATADTKGKAGIRKAVSDHFAASMRAGDLAAAPVWFAIQEGLTSAKKPAAPAPVNPVEVITARVRDLLHAAIALAEGAITPDGLGAEWTDDNLATLANRVRTVCNEFPEMFAYATPGADTAAHKLASAKVTRSTARNSIEDVFARAFDGQDAGTVLTVTDIRNMGKTDDYTPSAGAIAARYRDGVCTVEGYEAVPATVDGPLSFRSI